MIVALMRTRMAPGARSGHAAMARRMGRLAGTVPGYLSHKSFVAADGERVLVTEFASEESLRRWAADPAHLEAKAAGTRFFSECRVQVCSVLTDTPASFLDHARTARALRCAAWGAWCAALARRLAARWERFWDERAARAPALRPGGARDNAFAEDRRRPPP